MFEYITNFVSNFPIFFQLLIYYNDNGDDDGWGGGDDIGEVGDFKYIILTMNTLQVVIVLLVLVCFVLSHLFFNC